MSETMFSDSVKCDKCGAIDFVNGLTMVDGRWLCLGCGHGEKAELDDEE